MDVQELTISGEFTKSLAPQAGRTVVIKFGGELVEQEPVIRGLIQQVIEVKKQGVNVILVHGGGKQIDAELKSAGIEPKWFEDKRRDTDEATLEITHRCLNQISTDLIELFFDESFNRGYRFTPAGLGGHPMIKAVPYIEGSDTRTGKVLSVEGDALRQRADYYTVPIIHPVCAGEDNGYYNVNADDVAAAIAVAVKADRLILCSNIPGVLDKDKNLISEIAIEDVPGLIDNETITGGMIPKIQSAALVASNPDVGGVVILNGFDPQAIKSELLNESGAGTLIRAHAKSQAPQPDLQSKRVLGL